MRRGNSQKAKNKPKNNRNYPFRSYHQQYAANTNPFLAQTQGEKQRRAKSVNPAFSYSIQKSLEPAKPSLFDAQLEKALLHPKPHLLYPLQPASPEYKLIHDLSSTPSIHIQSINMIVNPLLWSRFSAQRKAKIVAKSNVVEMLSFFGENDSVIAAKLHQSDINPSALPPFSDNVCLLFHCTKAKKLEHVFDQGLDMRGAVSGICGRGIYFSDSPEKCIQYDTNGTLLVFGVMLGDCLATQAKSSAYREPPKIDEEKRNTSDQFFDSIVCRPAGMNEFVIFQNDQSVPLYAVKYTRSNSGGNQMRTIASKYAKGRQGLPPIAFYEPHNLARSNATEWPFIASSIFDTLNPQPGSHSADILDTTAHSIPHAKLRTVEHVDLTLPHSSSSARQRCPSTVIDLVNSKKAKLDFVKSDVVVIDSDDDGDENVTFNIQSRMSNNQQPAQNVTEKDPPAEKQVECTICFSEYPQESRLWITLNCGHKLCQSCHSHILQDRVTMSGTRSSFCKCPFCAVVDGMEIGTCPDGTMNTVHRGNWILVTYTFRQQPHFFVRTTCFPNTRQGRRVIDLMTVAFDRRLVFSIGTSLSTGITNTVVWNIHHKTSTTGGAANHGYPDDGYLDRVTMELRERGVF